jgi:dephospho-CoA kinase
VALVVGVTGGIGSGKSAVTDRLANLGITIVDADVAARVVVEPGQPALQAIADHFGSGVIKEDGSLDRAALREIVFEHPDERQWLESITHPAIREEIICQLRSADSPYVVLSSPLLIEASQNDFVDLVVVVDVPESTQLERTMKRDDNSADLVRQIMAAQLNREDRLRAADLIIDNDGNLEELHQHVDALHKQLLVKASTLQA